jgi:hypothetical protein
MLTGVAAAPAGMNAGENVQLLLLSVGSGCTKLQVKDTGAAKVVPLAGVAVKL